MVTSLIILIQETDKKDNRQICKFKPLLILLVLLLLGQFNNAVSFVGQEDKKTKTTSTT